ncbi:MAG: Fe-S cluster assembly protein SufB [Bacteroidales bacterium]|nr:Fe-S cluster assembly protein SufB [Bacteroidales bacterium]
MKNNNEQQNNNKERNNERPQEKNEFVRSVAEKMYEFGFTTDVHTEIIDKGLNEDVVRLISQKKGEPEWLLQFRLDAYRYWLTQQQPEWGHVHLPEIDYQAISYYADPTAKSKKGPETVDEIDPELMKTFDKLGIPLEERLALSGTAVDAVMDSVSVKTTFKEKLSEKGIIFCSISEAVKQYPDLVRQYLGTVVPPRDNYFAALNSAVFSDGSFVYIPKNTRCPMELSTYFRINARNTGQFERTLIVCDEGSYVSYLEGCTAPMRDENQLHAAIVEIVINDHAEVKYSTVQNWYPGDAEGKGGVLNLVTKRGDLRGVNSKLSWTQVETGSAITWKYPSCVLRGDNSQAEFYSVAVTNNHQEADTGTKMIHLGKNTRSTIISKGISAGYSENSYRGLVRVGKQADGARNYSSCDSLLLGSNCGAHTFPYMDIHNNTATVEHEATTSKINEDQLFYCNQRGISTEEAVGLIVNGYAKDVINKLPMEFAVEAQKLLNVSLEGSVG